MNPTTAIENLRTYCQRFGVFIEEASITRLYMAVSRAVVAIRRNAGRGDWPWVNAQAQIATTDGTLGPYSMPAEFYRFAMESKVYRYGYTEASGQVLAPVRASETSRHDLIYRVDEGALYFRDNPGTTTITVNFLPEFDATADETTINAALTLIPGNLFDVLADFVVADFMAESPDTESIGNSSLQKADINLALEWQNYRRGMVKQRQRSPKGMDGHPFDGIGRPNNLGGHSRYIHRRGYR